MKFKSLFLLLALTLTLQTVQSQSINLNLYGSTNDTYLVGGDLMVKHPNGLVFGIGGTHAATTFFTSEQRKGNDYTDHSNNLAKNYPDLTNPTNFKYIREVFIENRGTVTGLIGYSFKKTTIVTDLGMAFQQEIKLATTGVISNPITPLSTNYWQSFTVGPKFLYGGTITQSFSGRLGALVGYNNIQKFKFGLTYRITPSKMFNW